MGKSFDLEAIPTYEGACAALKATKPLIFINFNPNSAQDRQFAEEVGEELQKQGLSIVSEHTLLVGQDRKSVLSNGAQTCSHMINIASADTGAEGLHRKWHGITSERGEELSKGHTHNFFLAKSKSQSDAFLADQREPTYVGTWQDSKTRRGFILGLLVAGPGGRGYIATDKPHRGYEAPSIDWSGEKFAYLLSQGVTRQEIAEVAPNLAKRSKRFKQIVIVNMNQETFHNESRMDNAFVLNDEDQHGKPTKDVGIVCKCGRCGNPREVYTVDKSADGTHGVVIVRNDPCRSCGVTANISPVPEYTLQKALDQIFAK
jgi:hypothetical protein